MDAREHFAEQEGLIETVQEKLYSDIGRENETTATSASGKGQLDVECLIFQIFRSHWMSCEMKSNVLVF